MRTDPHVLTICAAGLVYRKPANGKQGQRQHQRDKYPQSVKPLCRRHIGKLGISITAVVALSVSSIAQSLSKSSIWVNLAPILIRAPLFLTVFAPTERFDYPETRLKTVSLRIVAPGLLTRCLFLGGFS
jgi:hypothetical protein